MIEKEIPLSGGNVNLEVVRVGNTVRRSISAISPTVHKLLQHLEQKGFDGCPKFLGIDDKHREILSYLEGETGIPAYIWQDDKPLIATAQLLKHYHEATLDFAKNESMTWGISYPDISRHEVICHNDFAPYNFIYKQQSPYAIIDFDLVGPGPRLRDVAYAAYWLTPLSFNSEDQKGFTDSDIKNRSRRLHLFCNTYGLKASHELLDMVFEVLSFMGNKQHTEKVVGFESASKLESNGHLAHWQKEAKSFYKHRSRLEANLSEA
jgi:hypothetical protein